MGPGKGIDIVDMKRWTLWEYYILLRPWMGYDYIIIQVVCWVELPEQRILCPIFCENMDPDKWDTTVWYRVTQKSRGFRKLTGCQRDPWDRSVTYMARLQNSRCLCSTLGLISVPLAHAGLKRNKLRPCLSH